MPVTIGGGRHLFLSRIAAPMVGGIVPSTVNFFEYFAFLSTGSRQFYSDCLHNKLHKNYINVICAFGNRKVVNSSI